ncbi:MAG: heme biosynthesis HemY N-terminal domain-containing protein, partial [Alphaproteobacteria bacterium]
MWRAFWLFIKIGIAVAVAVWLAERPGLVVVDWQGWHLEASVGFVALAVFLLVVVAALTYNSWRSIKSVPRRVVEARRGHRRAVGYRALTLGMVAVAAGDVEEAKRQAKKAEGLLNDRPLTQLLTAQSAQLGGDEVAAQRYFKAMLEQPETEFLGLRGLITQALKSGDKAQALNLVERANRLRPGTPWVLDALVELHGGEGEWRAAQLALEEGLRRKAIPAAAGTRSLAALI